MDNTISYKVTTYVPLENAAEVKQAAIQAGAGRIGAYSGCVFSIPGTGEFTPSLEANPAIGTPGERESVQELKLEMTCGGDVVRGVVEAIREAHPYEEVVVDVYKLEKF